MATTLAGAGEESADQDRVAHGATDDDAANDNAAALISDMMELSKRKIFENGWRTFSAYARNKVYNEDQLHRGTSHPSDPTLILALILAPQPALEKYSHEANYKSPAFTY
jgi:hypothetical protein